ncbi:hypothetical protein SAMN02745866_01600 [Alteromonadaceae bacterium Bs31]|nr:hypothetical protein SAMN02745866_01600 [Alteromonadaceae bacterium Bs31]
MIKVPGLIKVGVLLVILLASSACISPVRTYSGKAFLRSGSPLIALNGKALAGVYELYVEPGEQQVRALFKTALHEYVCTFEWAAVAETRYEISANENQHPLTLYRWERRNSLWAVRLDPVAPVSCTVYSPAG